MQVNQIITGAGKRISLGPLWEEIESEALA